MDPALNTAIMEILPTWQYYPIVQSVSTDASIETGLRERKRRQTRAALSLAAIRLCVQRGWEDVTVDDIAADANVSPRTFRNYFSTKAEAVAAGHRERMLRIAEGLRARPASEPLWVAITNSAAAQVQLAEVIADRVGARRGKDLYPQMASAVVAAVVATVVDRWLRDGPSGSIVPLLRKAFELVSTGLPENKGRTGK